MKTNESEQGNSEPFFLSQKKLQWKQMKVNKDTVNLSSLSKKWKWKQMKVNRETVNPFFSLKKSESENNQKWTGIRWTCLLSQKSESENKRQWTGTLQICYFSLEKVKVKTNESEEEDSQPFFFLFKKLKVKTNESEQGDCKPVFV